MCAGLLAQQGCRRRQPLPLRAPLKPPPVVVDAAQPSAVLLRVLHERAVPLACYDAARRTLRGGEDCAQLLAPDLQVRLAAEKQSRLGAATTISCRAGAGSAQRVTRSAWKIALPAPPPPPPPPPPEPESPKPGKKPSVMKELAAMFAPSPPTPKANDGKPIFALWSTGGLPQVERSPMPSYAAPLTPMERRYFFHYAVQRQPPDALHRCGMIDDDLQAVSQWSVDLDSDGLGERLTEVRLPIRGGCPVEAALAAVFVTPGDQPAALRPLRAIAGEPARGISLHPFLAVDLDGDGRLEVWIQQSGGKGQPVTDSVSLFQDGGLIVLSELTCD